MEETGSCLGAVEGNRYCVSVTVLHTYIWYLADFTIFSRSYIVSSLLYR